MVNCRPNSPKRDMTKENVLYKYESFFAFSLSVALFIYLILRSIYSPILHDEIATFYHYIQPGIYFPPEAHWDANNHILNSLLTDWSYQLFGSHPWALRLPNVLSFLLFFWAVWKIAGKLQNVFLRWGFLLALTMSHYMFEYFGETRGYGLSMAFLLWGLYLLIRYLKVSGYLYLVGALIGLLLATSANLTLINSCLLIGVVILFLILTNKKMVVQVKLAHLVTVFVGFVLLFPLINFAFELKERGALYYGGKSGFWDYTGGTLAQLYLGHFSFLIATLLTILFVIILILFFINWKNQQLSLNELIKLPSFIWVYLLVGSLIGIFATRYLLDVNFPEDRAAMYLFPYYIGALVFVIDSSRIKKLNLSLLFAVPLFFFPLQFLTKVNLKTASFSMEERAPQGFYDIIKNTPRVDQYPLTVGGYITQVLCWHYMNYQDGGNEGRMLFNNHVDTLSDFQIVNKIRTLDSSFLLQYEKINEEPINDLNLYKRKINLTKELVLFRDSITNWTHGKMEYFGFLEIEVPDSLKGKPVFVGVEATLHSSSKPFIASIVVSQKKENYEELNQEVLKLDWMKKVWDNSPRNLNQGIVVPEIDTETKYLIVYLWNQKEVDFLVHDGVCKLFLLK